MGHHASKPARVQSEPTNCWGQSNQHNEVSALQKEGHIVFAPKKVETPSRIITRLPSLMLLPLHLYEHCCSTTTLTTTTTTTTTVTTTAIAATTTTTAISTTTSIIIITILLLLLLLLLTLLLLLLLLLVRLDAEATATIATTLPPMLLVRLLSPCSVYVKLVLLLVMLVTARTLLWGQKTCQSTAQGMATLFKEHVTTNDEWTRRC